MKKLAVLWILLCCASFLYAQNSMTLDDAILDSVNFFSPKVASGSTIAVINFEAETQNLSDFIVQELLVGFANTGNVRVVERSRLEMLEAELNFNMSGSVSDETAQGIGRMIGAQVLFSGSITQYRDMYRMRVQAIAVETAEIIGIRTIDIRYSSTLTGLLGRINPADQWKCQWLYFGLGGGYALTVQEPKKYLEANDIWLGDLPVGFSFFAMVQPFDLFGMSFNLVGSSFSGINLLFEPTLVMRPSIFEINAFFGPGLNMMFINEVYTHFVFSGGLRAGVHLGPGVLFAESRYVGVLCDYTNPWTGEYGTDMAGNVIFSLGYKIGIIPRKK